MVIRNSYSCKITLQFTKLFRHRLGYLLDHEGAIQKSWILGHPFQQQIAMPDHRRQLVDEIMGDWAIRLICFVATILHTASSFSALIGVLI